MRTTKLRDKAFRSRLRLKEKRIELQDERNALSELDTKFMKAIRLFWQQDIAVEKSLLEEIYQQLEEKRDEIGSLQYEYDQAEDEYEAVEAQLERAESLLQLSLHRITDQGNDQELDTQSTIGTSKLSEPSTIFAENDEQYEFQQYQSRVGDARIMRERLKDYFIELSKRAAAPKNMVVVDRGSDLSDSSSTNDLKAVYSKTKLELKTIEQDLEDWEKGAKEGPIPHLTQLSPGKPGTTLNSDTSSVTSSPYLRTSNRPKRTGGSSIRPNVNGIRPRFKSWIWNRFRRFPVDSAGIKVTSYGDSTMSMDDRLWAQHVLRNSTEFGEIASSKFGDRAGSRSVSIKERWIKRSKLLVFYSSKALKAVHDYNVQFPAIGLQFGNKSDLSWPAFHQCNKPFKKEILEVEAFSKYESFNNREIPYNDEILELDMFSEYESRSV